jgi:hypothetical protein
LWVEGLADKKLLKTEYAHFESKNRARFLDIGKKMQEKQKKEAQTETKQ